MNTQAAGLQRDNYIDQRNALEKELFLTTLLDFGEALIMSGAEIYRVEDTMRRIGAAYGAVSTDVFAITSNIIATVEMPDGHVVTQTRRIRSSSTNDFARLSALNALSREYCAAPFSIVRLSERLHQIASQQPRRVELLAGSIVTAAAFAVFFGGGAQDAILAALGACLIWWMQQRIAPVCMNDTVYTFLASFAVSLAVNAIGRLWPVFDTDMVMIGDIMLLIPGVMTTNAIRDFLLGDTLSGAMRLMQALLLAGVLALGVVSAMGLLRWVL